MIRNILVLDSMSPEMEELKKSVAGIVPSVNLDFSEDISEVRQYFKKNFYGIIIIDLSFLNREILEFLDEIRTGNFYGEIIFTGDYTLNETVRKISDLKFLDVLIKPISSEWLTEKIEKFFESKLSIGNSLGKINTELFLRLFHAGKCTSTLRINCLNDSGIVRFEEGEIVSVRYNEETGVPALAEILTLCNGKIQIENNPIVIKKQRMEFSSGLFEAAKMVEKNSSANRILERDENIIDIILLKFRKIAGIKNKKLNKITDYLKDYKSDNSMDAEIDLIERVAGEIKDIKKKIDFKKSMMLFLKEREKNIEMRRNS